VKVTKKWNVSGVDVGVNSVKSEIKVESRCKPGRSAEDFAEIVIVHSGKYLVASHHERTGTSLSFAFK